MQTVTAAVGFRDAKSLATAELAPLLALNNAHASELSLLTMGRLRELLDMAWLALAAEDGAAMLLAFAADAAYDNPNFRWFRERYASFVYIDRVVVAASARGRGLARALYEAALAHAAADGQSRLCCEVNLEPPNPASDAFHAALRFAAVGQATLGSGKIVRYLTRPVSLEAP